MSPKFEVCPTCEGEGSIVHRALSVWTQADADEDPDSFEAMLAGRYDVTCDECNGLRVVDAARRAAYADEREDHFTRLAESGIYPGSPDYF